MYAFGNSRDHPPRAGRGHTRDLAAGAGRQQTQVSMRGNNGRPRRAVESKAPNELAISSELTDEQILYFGLCYVGFDHERQGRVKSGSMLLLDRFISHYGPVPSTVRYLMEALAKKFSPTQYYLKSVLMTLNWFKCYQTEHVLAGVWQFGEEYIRNKVKEVACAIQSLYGETIIFDPSIFDADEVHWLSVDTVNYKTQEFRCNPSTCWFDPKSCSAALKYEFGVATRHDFCVWKNGPFPPGKYHDKTIFCGAENKDTPKHEWSRSALYFKLPNGKKAIADSAYEGIPEKVTVKRQGQSKEVTEFIDRAQNRQEAYHARLDSYAVLRDRFRHGTSTKNKMDLHNMCVEAIMVVVHFDLRSRPLWET